jgi:hypothetical protein
MGQDARQTVVEIEQTREELARKVDELVGRAKVEAAEAGKKMAIVGAVMVGLLVLSYVAKKRISH